MKRFLKNAILIMVVVCFILNIANLIGQVIRTYTVTPRIAQVAESMDYTNITQEEGYKMAASFYAAGYGGALELQVGIIIISISIGIILGMINTFHQGSKTKLLLLFFGGLLLFVLFITICDIIYYGDYSDLLFRFKNEYVYKLDRTWIGYTVVFFVLYAIKIFITIRKTKELNEIIKSKQENVKG